MIGRILASVAIIGLMATGVPAMAQSTTPPDQQSPKSSTLSQKSTDSTKARKSTAKKTDNGTMRNSASATQTTSGARTGTTSRASAQGHKLDNIADRLNACQAQPEAQRQSCMSSATSR
jgi:hypothetical protein